MRLSVSIPETKAANFSAARILAQLAPVFEIAGEGEARTFLASYPDLPKDLDLAVRLIGEIISLPNVQATINSRPVASLSKFWSALLCYRDSLGEHDKQAYCARQADRVGEAAGCPAWTCQARCPFICTRCLQVVRREGAPPVSDQLKAIAVLAEVDWCPNLRLPSSLG